MRSHARGPFYCVCGDHTWAKLTRGFVTLVSPIDADNLLHNWYAFVNQSGNVYAARKEPKHHYYLHRILMHPPTAMEIDHINRNGTDNRRGNLRLASKSENAMNRRKLGGSSRFKGVSFVVRPWPLKKPWRATFNNKTLGYFAAEEDAAEAYLQAARAAFGDFATQDSSAWRWPKEAVP